MGLLLSVLVGCVGVLELLACLRQASDGAMINMNPPTPCLSYHESADNDIQSIHDSLCSFSHSTAVRLPRGARHKLENLHEYSLRVRSELRSLDRNFDGRSTLSECSSRYLLGSRPDSRLSPDPGCLAREDDGTWCVRNADQRDDRHEDEHDDAEFRERLEQAVRSLAPPKPDRYVRVPTPIPFARDEETAAVYGSSSEDSLDRDSGNEAPIVRSFDGLPAIKHYEDSRSASSVDESEHDDGRIARRAPRKSPSPSEKPKSVQSIVARTVPPEKPDEPARADSAIPTGKETGRVFVSQKKPKSSKSSTTILRKPTRLKSRNAEISRSAESLNAQKRSKRDRDPERRKSDISVQTVRDLLRDMSTNTSPTSSPPLSRSDSKKSVSVEVQTTMEDLLSDEMLDEMENGVVGLSESRRDVLSRGSSAKKSFKSRRFRSSSGEGPDDRDGGSCALSGGVVTSVERSRDKRDKRSLRVSSFEDASEEDYERVRSIISEPTSESNGRRRVRKEESWSRSSNDEFMDAEDVSSGRPPIQYTTPDTDQNKAFWVIRLTVEAVRSIAAQIRIWRRVRQP